jgi:hypothetical protein
LIDIKQKVKEEKIKKQKKKIYKGQKQNEKNISTENKDTKTYKMTILI